MIRVLWLMVVVAAFSPTALYGQKIDATKLLGLTPDSGSLPLWSKPGIDDRTALGRIVREMPPAIFLVPGNG